MFTQYKRPCCANCCNKLAGNANRIHLKSRLEMPEWSATFNKNILKGYRPITNSTWQTLQSMFYIHNETGNIWTHLMAILMFTSLLFHNSTNPSLQPINLIDIVAIRMFYFGLLTCLIYSTLYHLFCCHSFRLNQLFAR